MCSVHAISIRFQEGPAVIYTAFAYKDLHETITIDKSLIRANGHFVVR